MNSIEFSLLIPVRVGRTISLHASALTFGGQTSPVNTGVLGATRAPLGGFSLC